MGRSKPIQNIVKVQTIEEANEAMAQLAKLKRKVELLNSELNDKIDALKTATAVAVAPLNAELVGIENGLLLFAEQNKEKLFQGKRSVEMDYGKIGYQRSTEIKPEPKMTWEKILGRMKDLEFLDGIRIKEQANKEAMREWADEKLREVGARRIYKDEFGYTLDEVKVKALLG